MIYTHLSCSYAYICVYIVCISCVYHIHIYTYTRIYPLIEMILFKCICLLWLWFLCLFGVNHLECQPGPLSALICVFGNRLIPHLRPSSFLMTPLPGYDQTSRGTDSSRTNQTLSSCNRKLGSGHLVCSPGAGRWLQDRSWIARNWVTESPFVQRMKMGQQSQDPKAEGSGQSGHLRAHRCTSCPQSHSNFSLVVFLFHDSLSRIFCLSLA